MSASNNSNNSNQQTLAESGANARPPMLEKGNYIPWESRFRRFLENQLEEGERMWHSIQHGPYQRPLVPNPDNPEDQILEPLSKMTEGDKKKYIADVRVMNYILQAIPNDIYNSVDACANAKEMWERIKRLMHGSDITATVRHSRLMDEFDKFAAKYGESLDSVHERLMTLVTIMDRNNVRPIPVAINTKFLNFLQPEWSKYVTMVRQNQSDKVISYDMLYDSLVQFEPHVLASRAKKAAKNHDLLALIAHSHASSSHLHANSSYSPQSYYVTHPPSVIDYDDEYQEDKLTTAMILLARAISQKFSSPTNNRLCVSLNTKNQVVVPDGRVDIQTKNAGNASDETNKIVQRVPRTDYTPSKVNVQCYNCNEKGHYDHDCQKPKVCDAKYFREQMLLVMKDEAGSHLSNEENGFMLDNAYADGTTDTVPSYDDKAVSQVHALSKAHEQMSHEKRKTIIQTTDDDQIDSSIIFNDMYVDNNGGMSKHDSIAHEENHEIQMLAYNVQREAKKQKHVNNELKKQKVLLQQELETFKDRVKTFESQAVQCSKYKDTCDDLKRELQNDKDTIDRLLKEKDKIQSDCFKIENEKLLIQHETQLAKKAFRELEDQYLEDIVDLEEKLSSHDRIVYKIDGLGYQNPKRLKKAIAAQPKMYDGDMLYSKKLIINSPDSEETLEDAKEKSKDVPSESPVLKMPNESQLLKMIDKLGNALTGFYTKINKTLLKDAERRWLSDSQNELREFYKTNVIPMSRSLYKNLKDIKEELIEEVQEMLNIFESMEQRVNEKSPTEILLQKEIDRLLEVSLTSEIRDCVLLSAAQQKHDLLKDELEKSSNDSKEIQANLLHRIKILENDFQRSQAQSIDFELKLQHQKEKMACDVSWKSKLSTLNTENVLLKDQAESVVQERENIKLEFQKLFNSIKVTRAQHQKEVDELIQCVTQKTYAYGDVRAENQDLLITIFELKSKLRTIEKGKTVNTKIDSSETLGKRCVARHALSRKFSVKRALFTSPLAAKSNNLRATSVVTKSRLSVAKTLTLTSKVSSVLTLSSDSRTTRTLSSYMNNKIVTSKKWQKWFEYQHGFNWTPRRKYVQSQSSVTKSKTSVRPKTKTPVSTQKWVVKLSTLPSAFVSCNAGDLACSVDC
ncbi:putative ribonuclease H-like domain-containing protein [Tanacetum coccineum]